MNIFGIEISDKIYVPVIIIFCSILVDIIINSILSNKIKVSNKLSKHEQRSRKTILMIIKNIVNIIIIIIAILSILQVFGVNTNALVAGVGAISVIIGLAFQDVLKDIFVGMSIILESQFAIGELVEINGFKGEVISLSLKSTRLKSYTGEIKIIANRTISEVTNYSLCDVLVKIYISVAYEENIEKIEKNLNEIIENLNKEITNLKDKITIEGVDSLSESSVNFLLTTRANAKDEYSIKRKILREIKLNFDKNKIKIPYPQVEVHYEK